MQIIVPPGRRRASAVRSALLLPLLGMVSAALAQTDPITEAVLGKKETPFLERLSAAFQDVTNLAILAGGLAAAYGIAAGMTAFFARRRYPPYAARIATWIALTLWLLLIPVVLLRMDLPVYGWIVVGVIVMALSVGLLRPRPEPD